MSATARLDDTSSQAMPGQMNGPKQVNMHSRMSMMHDHMMSQMPHK
jgi:hypothetical protein